MGKIKVEAKVLEGIKAVRDSGLTNMFDLKVVVKLCQQWGYETAADWIMQNKDLYCEGIFKGFEPVEENPGLAKLGDFFPDSLKKKGGD